MIASLVSCRPNEGQEEKPTKKLSGKEVVEKLEELGFFKLTDESELEEVQVAFQESYTEWGLFEGEMRGETLQFKDNRFYRIDCEALFEVGGLTEYLSPVQRSFHKLGLELAFDNEKSDQDSNRWIHTIELNDTEYTAFDGSFSHDDWNIAFVNFIEMLNAELSRQSSNEQFYPVRGGNDGAMVLLTSKQFEFVRAHYPRDEGHPMTMGEWKEKHGL